jgi:hypothetical protein
MGAAGVNSGPTGWRTTPAVTRPVHRKTGRGGVFVLAALGVTIATSVVAFTAWRAHDRPARTRRSSWRGLPPSVTTIEAGSGRPEVESRIFQVAEATGRVEAHREGRWVLVSRGDVLTQDDVVRTVSGRALLKFGVATEVELRDRVEIRLDSISRAGASLDLRRGKVVARVGRAASNIVITAANTRTANDRSAPARFVVLADEHGQVTVAATEGAARFESGGQAVVIPAGSVSQAAAGHRPDNPEMIPEEIFLSVTWPTRESRDDDVIPIGGRVNPRSSVHVNGVTAELDRNGRFAASVPVHDGANPVVVEVEDISGRVKAEKREIRKIPTRPPDLEPIKTELWSPR